MSRKFYYTDTWIDAQEMHRTNPQTFCVPPENKLDEIAVGDTVKISNGVERFWVEIKEISDAYYFGRIDNNLELMRGYNFNDIVRFERKHIYDIHTPEDKKKIIDEINRKLEESEQEPEDE